MCRFITAIPKATTVMKETQRPRPSVSPIDSREMPPGLEYRLLLMVVYKCCICALVRLSKAGVDGIE